MDQNIGPLAINIPLIIAQILGFLILLWGLNKFVFKAIFNILDDRQRLIQETYDQLDVDRKRMEDTRTQYERRLQGIEEEARERIQSAVKEAQDLRDRLIADAQTQATAITTDAHNEAERERQKVFLEMRQQVVSLAVAAAGKIVGESLDGARHAKLADDFIADIGSRNAAVKAAPTESFSQNGTASV